MSRVAFLRKIFLNITLVLLITIGISIDIVYAGPIYGISNLDGQPLTDIESAFFPFYKLFTASLNSGIYKPSINKKFAFGFQSSLASIPKEGVFENASVNALVVPNIYIGVGIWKFNIFARLLGTPVKSDNYLFTFGGGLAFNYEVFTADKISGIVQAIGTFHACYGLLELNNIMTYGGDIILSVRIYDIVTPYLDIGYKHSIFNTKITPLGATNNYIKQGGQVFTSFGVCVFDILSYEITFAPSITHTISVGYEF